MMHIYSVGRVFCRIDTFGVSKKKLEDRSFFFSTERVFGRRSLLRISGWSSALWWTLLVIADVVQALQVLNIIELSKPERWYWTSRPKRGCVCVCFVCLQFCVCISDLWRSAQTLTVWWSSLCANSHPTLCLLLRQGVVWSGTAGPQVQTSLLPLPGS